MNFIIGAGGLAKEVFYVFENSYYKNQKFDGFIELEPKINTLSINDDNYPVIAEKDFFKHYHKSNNINLFIGIGNQKLLEPIIQKYQGFNFPNLIDRRSNVDLKHISIGNGNIITAGVIFTVDIIINSYNIFNLSCTVGHDTNIGSYNIFNPGSNISGGVQIGNSNLFGTNSTVLQYMKIKHNNIIGASSLINKNIDSNGTYVGIPAKKIN